MQVGLMAPQGWKGEYDGWDPAAAWARTVSSPPGRGARLRIALGVRPLPHGPRADRRVTFESFSVLAALAMAHLACPPRPHGRLHRVPQPRPHGEAVLDPRRHQRRPVRAGHRRRLEGGRVAGIRLRLPADRRADGCLRRPPRGHHSDARARPRDLRGPRTPTSATRSTCRRVSSSRGSRSSSAATASSEPPARGQVRRRAQLRVPRRPRRSPSGSSPSARAARPRAATRPPCASRSTSATRRCATRARTGRPARRVAEVGLDRFVASRRAGHRPLEAQAAFADDCRAAGLEPAGSRATGSPSAPDGGSRGRPIRRSGA